MDVPQMESRGEMSDPGRTGSSSHDPGPQTASAPGRALGGFNSCGTISLVEGADNSHTMVPTGEHATRRLCPDLGGAPAAGHVEFYGIVVESTQSNPEQTSSATPTMPPADLRHSQEQGQREAWEIQRQMTAASKRFSNPDHGQRRQSLLRKCQPSGPVVGDAIQGHLLSLRLGGVLGAV